MRNVHDQTSNPLCIPMQQLVPMSAGQGASCGLMWPLRSHLGPLILTMWDGVPFAIHLSEGDHSLTYFQVKPTATLPGLLLSEPEIVVEVGSQYDANRLSDPPGALVLSDGKVFMAALPFNGMFRDTAYVPLWGGGTNEASGVKIGFLRWSLAACDGDQRLTLWRQECTPVV